MSTKCSMIILALLVGSSLGVRAEPPDWPIVLSSVFQAQVQAADGAEAWAYDLDNDVTSAEPDRGVSIGGFRVGYFTSDLAPQMLFLAKEFDRGSLPLLRCHAVVVEPVVVRGELKWERVDTHITDEPWACGELIGPESESDQQEPLRVSGCIESLDGDRRAGTVALSLDRSGLSLSPFDPAAANAGCEDQVDVVIRTRKSGEPSDAIVVGRVAEKLRYRERVRRIRDFIAAHDSYKLRSNDRADDIIVSAPDALGNLTARLEAEGMEYRVQPRYVAGPDNYFRTYMDVNVTGITKPLSDQ